MCLSQSESSMSKKERAMTQTERKESRRMYRAWSQGRIPDYLELSGAVQNAPERTGTDRTKKRTDNLISTVRRLP